MQQNRKWIHVSYWLPLVALLVLYLVKSLSFPLHDFSNSYFAAKLLTQTTEPEKILFDIYAFNNYVWSQGYPEVLVDFYLNSPFTLAAFFPLTLIENAYTAKIIFNILSSVLFLYALWLLVKTQVAEKQNQLFLVFVPLFFFVPIRNQILFGQTYFLVFSLIVIFIYFLEKNKNLLSVSLLGTAALLKIFPLFYGVILVINKQWKAILWGLIATAIIIGISIPITGIGIWTSYLFDVLPNAMANNSTVNFQFNAQSLDVFLKTVFVHDSYYNPDAIFNNPQAYIFLKWIIKSAILGLAMCISFLNKKQPFKILVIWVATLFLVQSRTATYAQILWLIPAIYVYQSRMLPVMKIAFFTLLFLVCNLPLSSLQNLPVFFQFSRMWLTLILVFILFYQFLEKNYFASILKTIAITAIILAPLQLRSIFVINQSIGEYVLTKEYFIVHDFTEIAGKLHYSAIGRNGNEQRETNITIQSFDTNACSVLEGQIFLHGNQLTQNAALKKKPVLINGTYVYYLSDYNSRRGAFTLKKMDITNLQE